jgi:GNAT superfamily N-acetyltransferase
LIDIRLAVPADAALLPEVETSAGTAFLDLPGMAWVADGAPISADGQRRLIALGAVWVALDEGAIQGFLSAEALGDCLHIWELSVRLVAQGQGIGRALLQAAIAFAATQNLAQVTLTTFKDVPWNAPFYARLGFKHLDQAALSPRLQEVLAQEADSGVPTHLRCAMAMLVPAS